MPCTPAEYTSNVAAVVSSLNELVGFNAPAVPQRFIIKLPEIVFDGVTFELNSPLSLMLYEDEDREAWYCEDEGHHFLARGESRECAVHSLSEDFAVYWRVIAQSPEEELDEHARGLRKFMLSSVKSVNTF